MAERDKAKTMETTLSSTFSILVKSLLGKIISVPVSLDDTVLDLKMKLFALECFYYPFRTHLIHDRQLLKDELTLRHYNITSNSIVNHVLRRKYQARGGEWPWEQAGLWLPRGKGQRTVSQGALCLGREELGGEGRKGNGCEGMLLLM